LSLATKEKRKEWDILLRHQKLQLIYHLVKKELHIRKKQNHLKEGQKKALDRNLKYPKKD
jgi:hypothetical protein